MVYENRKVNEKEGGEEREGGFCCIVQLRVEICFSRKEEVFLILK